MLRRMRTAAPMTLGDRMTPAKVPAGSLPQSDIPLEFNEDLVRELALLSDAPPGIAESTVALLRLGARALLEELDLIELCGERPPLKITITPYGWDVIDKCGRWAEQATEDDWRKGRVVEGFRALRTATTTTTT
jgi:hypothetical protein